MEKFDITFIKFKGLLKNRKAIKDISKEDVHRMANNAWDKTYNYIDTKKKSLSALAKDKFSKFSKFSKFNK